MKKLFGVAFLAIGLSGSGAFAEANGTQKSAVDSSGYCTEEVVVDFLALANEAQSMMDRMTSELEKLGQTPNDSAAASRLESIGVEFQNHVQSFRATYGDFSCRHSASGQILSPSALYRSMDEMKEKMAVAKAERDRAQSGSVAECAPAMSAAQTAMVERLKPVADLMIQTMPSMVRKAQAGQSIELERKIIRQGATFTVNEIQQFRTQFPGEFECTYTNPTSAQKSILNSKMMDQQAAQLRDQISQMN